MTVAATTPPRTRPTTRATSGLTPPMLGRTRPFPALSGRFPAPKGDCSSERGRAFTGLGMHTAESVLGSMADADRHGAAAARRTTDAGELPRGTRRHPHLAGGDGELG